ncbi:MAG: hypothetical protein M3N52_05210, partial [Actinomycetota bacterium]|nr:hypothetical protein [Actinomycetota bacterium]
MSPSAPTLTPDDVVRRIGDSSEAALRYALSPDPQLSRLSRKVRDALIADLPPVTAGALLGPAALARHFVASAAIGRYRDLFALWELFRHRPADCKPVLAERSRALERARQALATAVRLGLWGRAERVARDIADAQGLIWQWLREVIVEDLEAVGRRPAIASALLHREPDLDIPLPSQPDDRWLAEAAAALDSGPLAPAVDAVLAAHVDRLPTTVATLSLAQERYPGQVAALLEHVDVTGPDIGSIMAWARDHGHAARLRERVRDVVAATAERDRAESLALWQAWNERGVEFEPPAPLRVPTLDGLDLGRPETARLVAWLMADGAGLDPQATLEDLARRNRQLAEKTYEAFVCAGLRVALPRSLESNPIVRDGTRCPHCAAWTWVRPGHERRCPRQGEGGREALAGGRGPDEGED